MKIPSKKENVVFISKINPGRDNEISSILLAESIRKFSGIFEYYPILFFYPGKVDEISDLTRARLNELNVSLIPSPIVPSKKEPFFHWEVNVLAEFETIIRNLSNVMVWMDSNTLLLNPPLDIIFVLEKMKLAYKPVHHLLIGSIYDQPVDPFWEEIYSICKVEPDDIFPMQPMIEDILMRPYFNAGFLVCRPMDGLFKNWSKAFQDGVKSPIIQEYLRKDPIYNIFLHQALLSGVILHQYSKEEILEMPNTYNYPLHLWDDDQTKRKPTKLDEYVTIRHEGLSEPEVWMRNNPFNEEITQWLKERLAFFQDAPK